MIKLEHVGLLRQGQWILKDINWEVKAGEQWVMLGLNGAGKTALLHMLSAFHFPVTGEVTVLGRRFGKDPLGEGLRQDIGLVSQTLKQRFYVEDTAYQIVLSGGFSSIGLYETPTDQMRDKAKQLLKDVGIFHYADQAYEKLSQGEKQRVMIARSLMRDPKLLILDEPTTGLDFVAKEQLLETVESIMKKDNPPLVLYVTHHVDEILPTFTHVLMLKDGEVFRSGERRTLLTEASLSNFFQLPLEIMWQHERPYLFKK